MGGQCAGAVRHRGGESRQRQARHVPAGKAGALRQDNGRVYLQQAQSFLIVKILISQGPQEKRRILPGCGIRICAENIGGYAGRQALLIRIADIGVSPSAVLKGMCAALRQGGVRLACEPEEHHQGLRTGGGALQFIARLAAAEESQAVQRVRGLLLIGSKAGVPAQ